MSRPDIITCWTLEKWGLWSTSDCCLSCHEDHDEYGYYLVSLGDPQREPVLWEFSDVCCAASSAWRERGTVES